MLTITDSAKEKLIELLVEEQDPTLSLRTFVQGGGCSGFTYGFTLDSIKNEDDFEVPIDNFRILVDAMSMTYLSGATIDYKDEFLSKQFVISNPNAKHTCGCGSSFTV